MAELVDALVSGTSSRKGVQVRFLFRAPQLQHINTKTVSVHPTEFFLYFFSKKPVTKTVFLQYIIKAD